jgi:hypothetical protein
MFDVPDSELLNFSAAIKKEEEDNEDHRKRGGEKKKKILKEDEEEEGLTNFGDDLQMYSYTVNQKGKRYSSAMQLHDDDLQDDDEREPSGYDGLHSVEDEAGHLYSPYSSSHTARRGSTQSYDTDTDSYSYTSRSNSASNANPLAKSNPSQRSPMSNVNAFVASDSTQRSNSEYVDEDIRSESANEDRSRSGSLSSTSRSNFNPSPTSSRPTSGHAEKQSPRTERDGGKEKGGEKVEKSSSASHTLPIAKPTSKKRSPSFSPGTSPTPAYVKVSTLDKGIRRMRGFGLGFDLRVGLFSWFFWGLVGLVFDFLCCYFPRLTC